MKLRKVRIKSVLLVCFCVFGALLGLYVRGALHLTAAPAAVAPSSIIDDRSWMTDPWDDDESPYVQTEQEINDLAQRGQISEDYLAQSREQALGNLTDVQAIYKWALCANKVVGPMDAVFFSDNKPKIWKGMFNSLARPLAPESYIFEDANYRSLYSAHRLFAPVRSYHYSRMLFIAAFNEGDVVTSQESLTEFKRLGSRLQKVNPQDLQVKAMCASLETIILFRNHHEILGDLGKMQRLARELVKDNPKNPDFTLLLGLSQEFGWDFCHNDLGADAALATYNRYLHLDGATPKYCDIALKREKKLRLAELKWDKLRVVR